MRRDYGMVIIMDQNTQNVINYIKQQLYAGVTADEIQQQLVNAGHTTESVQRAFGIVQQTFVPTLAEAPAIMSDGLTPSGPSTENSSTTVANTFVAPMANGQKRGRIRAGWLLFKQSVRILSGNRGLLRYLGMTYLWVLSLNVISISLIAYVVYYSADMFSYQTSSNNNASIQVFWYSFAFMGYLLSYFIVNFYATALAANMLDIFRGERRSYTDYIAVARSKKGNIFMFSLISATVGMFLQYVVERIRFVGWIIAYLLGTAWNIGTMFVLPVIVEGNVSAPQAIKQSINFFKQTWGENITAKVTVNAPLFLINLGMLVAFSVLFFGALMSNSIVLVIIVTVIYILAAISLAVLGSFANSVINTALYFYAAHKAIPAAFSADMLNSVFIVKSKRGFFGRNKKATI